MAYFSENISNNIIYFPNAVLGVSPGRGLLILLGYLKYGYAWYKINCFVLISLNLGHRALISLTLRIRPQLDIHANG